MASLTTWISSSKGILVKSETTSKLNNMSLGSTFSTLISLTNSLESLMKDSMLPTRGPKIFAKYFASS